MKVRCTKKIEEIEQYLRKKIKERNGLAKTLKMHGTWVRYCDHGLLAVSVMTIGCGLGALPTRLAAPLCIAMGGVTLAMGIGQAGLKNASKRLEVKPQKHETIRLLAESKFHR